MGDGGNRERSLPGPLGDKLSKKITLADERFVERIRNGGIVMERLRDEGEAPDSMPREQEVLSFRRFLESEESRVMRLVCECSNAKGR